MKPYKLFLFAMAVVAAGVVAACGDDDDDGNGGTPDSGLTDVVTPTPVDDAATDGGGGPGSFPAYVQQLIETKTVATGTPDTEAVYGPFPDDDKFAFPATFFQ